MKQKFSRVLSLLVVLTLALALLVPCTALAAESYDFTSQKTTNGTNWTWDEGTKTLTLNNANLDCSGPGSSSVKLPAGSTIVLSGTNTITGGNDGDYTYGIQCAGDLTIKGSGTLSVTAHGAGISSIGISANGSSGSNNGTLTVTDGASVTVTAGNAYEGWSLGVAGNVVVGEGATLITKGNDIDSPSSYSYGIGSNASGPVVTLTVKKGGTLIAIGETNAVRLTAAPNLPAGTVVTGSGEACAVDGVVDDYLRSAEFRQDSGSGPYLAMIQTEMSDAVMNAPAMQLGMYVAAKTVKVSAPAASSSSTRYYVSTEPIEAPKTADPGVLAYGVMAVSALLSLGIVKKKEF